MNTQNQYPQRLYFFVPYNILPIQQAIQAGHSALEYARFWGGTDEYLRFIEFDKTWIILNGGTTNNSLNELERGSMQEIQAGLETIGIIHSTFYEPDLNNALTAICFLADERVWNKEKYPDFADWIAMKFELTYSHPMADEYMSKENPEEYIEWLNLIGGEKNAFLRELLRNKRLV